MTMVLYTAKVEDNGTLSLPEEAYEELGLRPGDMISVAFDKEELETAIALQEAFDDVANGRTMPAREALEELRQKYGIPR